MRRDFVNHRKIVRHNGPVVAGITLVIPAAGVDTAGFDTCTFIVGFGAIVAGAATSIEVHQSDDDGVADAYSALLGSKVTVADDDDDKLVYVEIERPRKRYLKCLVNRATQNSTVELILAVLSGAKRVPITADTTVAAGEKHVSPVEGTA